MKMEQGTLTQCCVRLQGVIMKINFKKELLVIMALLLLFGCSNNKEKYIKTLKNKLEDLNSLLNYIEDNYSDTIQNRLRKCERVVFIDCKKEGDLSIDYVCNYSDVINKMNHIGIREVRFEKIKVDCETVKKYTEVYFQEKKLFYYLIVYYLFEICKTKDPIETKTIYYKPVNEHWSVYMDSNFP